jgi:hypothetical protein
MNKELLLLTQKVKKILYNVLLIFFYKINHLIKRSKFYNNKSHISKKNIIVKIYIFFSLGNFLEAPNQFLKFNNLLHMR